MAILLVRSNSATSAAVSKCGTPLAVVRPLSLLSFMFDRPRPHGEWTVSTLGPVDAVRRAVLAFRRIAVVRLQHEIANSLVCTDVLNRSQQREAPTFISDAVLPAGKRHAAAVTAASLPNRKANQ